MKQQVQEQALRELRETFIAKDIAEKEYRAAVVAGRSDDDYDEWVIRYSRAKNNLSKATDAMLTAQQEVLGDDRYKIF